MINRKSLILTACLASAILVGCTVTELQDTTKAALVASGNASEENLQLVEGGGKILSAALPMPFEKEREIGGTIAVSSFNSQGSRVADETLQEYVTKVGLTVAAKSQRPDVPFRFAVVESDQVNAWAAPGGYIFVTTGLLLQMEDEAQLAGVLAHEIAHVTRYHLVTMLKKSDIFEGATQLASASGNDVQAAAQQLGPLTNLGVETLFNTGFSRPNEYEADEVGLDYAAAAGYDPRGLERVLIRLNSAGSQAKGGGWINATHPELAERISRLQAKWAAGYEGIEGALATDRFVAMVRRLH